MRKPSGVELNLQEIPVGSKPTGVARASECVSRCVGSHGHLRISLTFTYRGTHICVHQVRSYGFLMPPVDVSDFQPGRALACVANSVFEANACHVVHRPRVSQHTERESTLKGSNVTLFSYLSIAPTPTCRRLYHRLCHRRRQAHEREDGDNVCLM